MGVVYKITNLINNKIYVGRDIKNHSYYLGGGIIIKAAVKKYGRHNFIREIIEECTDEILSEREIFWIKELDARNPSIGYNISTGGEYGDTGKRYGESIKGKTFDEIHGKEKGDQIKAKYSYLQTHRWDSDEYREMMSEAISRGKKGKSLKATHKKNISKGLEGHECPLELREKLSIKNLAAIQKNSIRIKVTDESTGEEKFFNSIQNTCRKYGISLYDIKCDRVPGLKIERLNEVKTGSLCKPVNKYEFYQNGKLVETLYGNSEAIAFCKDKKLKYCLLVLKKSETGINKWNGWECKKMKNNEVTSN